jgi:glutamine amidotransferase
MKKKIVILDYKVGNFSSLKNTIQQLGHDVVISNNKIILKNSDYLILPGVGNFGEAIVNLKKLNLFNYIKFLAKRNKKIIGICLGMQVLCSNSQEAVGVKGLSIFNGNITKLNNNNIGWRKIIIHKKNSNFKFCNHNYFYFNHLYAYNNNKEMKLAEGYFNSSKIYPAIIKKKNVIGIQFHPEKSQNSGKKFFAEIFSNNNLYN